MITGNNRLNIQKRRLRIFDIVAGVLTAVIPVITASLLLRNLGRLIGKFVKSGENDKFDFARIFSQIRDAEISVHWLIPVILGLLLYLTAVYLLSRIKSKSLRVGLEIFLFAVFLLSALAAAILLTNVNGICFGRLLGKFIPLIDKL